KDNNIYVNLFISGNATLNLSGKSVEIIQQNNYPWDGDLKFTVNPKKSFGFSMLIRIPGWARNEAMPSDLYKFNGASDKKTVITINGKEVDFNIENGYAVLNKKWKKNDVIEVNLPMEVRKVVANPNVKSDAGKVALQRGPIMYCAEWLDNDGKASNLVIPVNTTFETEFKPELLNGIEVLKSKVPAIVIGNNGENIQTKTQDFMAIPYYAWANRGKGEMMMWFPEKIKDIDIVAAE